MLLDIHTHRNAAVPGECIFNVEPAWFEPVEGCYYSTPIRDKIAISCMLRQIHESSSHAIRHGLYIKNRKRLFCP